MSKNEASARPSFVQMVPEGDDRPRRVCSDCGFVDCENPRVVVGSVVSWQERILLCMCAEAARSIEDGVIKNPRDAEVGAIFGIGFAPNTGGPLAWIDRQGVANVVAELDVLAEKFGSRFTPAPVLRRMAENNERFFEQV